MYFLALAADYDGTIAEHGFVNAATCDALRRLKDTGRRLLLVTGRELADLRHAFAEIRLFDRVIAENGAVIYDPSADRETAIAPAPPAAFVEKLMALNVEPISVGRSVVATWVPHQTAVLSAIQELGLELQITFNKGAVMVLPPGVTKASGLKAALLEMGISAHNVVAVGDAENDHALLRLCGCAAAVANALPTTKHEADIQLSSDHGAGVAELIERMIRDDVRIVPPARYGMLVGTDRSGEQVYLEPARGVLIAGASGSGKSKFATLLTERMAERQLEFCLIDPEGDYQGLEHAVCVGDMALPPTAEESIRLLRETEVNAVIETIGLGIDGRRKLFEKLLPAVVDLQGRTGRPHWLLVDEVHQLLPAGAKEVPHRLLKDLTGKIFITLDPGMLHHRILKMVDVILAFGAAASDLLAAFAAARDIPAPAPGLAPELGEILYWSIASGRPPRTIRIEAPRQVHRRHTGKYAVGDVGERQSFYFRGPTGASVMRAGNLAQFLHLLEQVDDASWECHLRAGDYSAWFEGVIKDRELARETAAIEADAGLDPQESRRRIKEAVKRRYATPAQDS